LNKRTGKGGSLWQFRLWAVVVQTNPLPVGMNEFKIAVVVGPVENGENAGRRRGLG
jgi:hypothetical protein